MPPSVIPVGPWTHSGWVVGCRPSSPPSTVSDWWVCCVSEQRNEFLEEWAATLLGGEGSVDGRKGG